MVEIDSNNNPGPENVPAGAEVSDMMGEWGENGVCAQLCTGAMNMLPQLKWFPQDVKPDLVSLFLALFPKKFVEKVLLYETNKNLVSSKPLRMGEFLCWIGMWLLMATTYSKNRRDFWSGKKFCI